MMIPPRYAAFATVFPSKGEERDALLDGPDYGFDIHSERLIQMLDSKAMRDSVISKFNLAAHYDVEMNDIQGPDKLMKKYFKYIRFNKTLYSSVVISVTDTDPVLAAEIANYISHVVNHINANMIRESTMEGLRNIEAAIADRSMRIHALEDTLAKVKAGNMQLAAGTLTGQLDQRKSTMQTVQKRIDEIRRQFNIYNYENQINNLNTELSAARSQFLESSGKVESLQLEPTRPYSDSLMRIFKAEKEGASRRIQYYEAEIGKLVSVNAEYQMLTEKFEGEVALLRQSESAYNQLTGSFEPELENSQLLMKRQDLTWELTQLNELKRKYEVGRIALYDPTPAAYIVSPAVPTYEKISPQVALNTILAFAFGLFFTLVVLILSERIRESIRQTRSKA